MVDISLVQTNLGITSVPRPLCYLSLQRTEIRHWNAMRVLVAVIEIHELSMPPNL